MPNFFEEVKAAVIDDAALSQGDTSGAGRSVSRERSPGSLSLTALLPLTASPTRTPTSCFLLPLPTAKPLTSSLTGGLFSSQPPSLL